MRAEFGATLPALLITGDTAPQRLREARATGVPLLHKPVLPSQLYRAMTAVLNGRELDSSLRRSRRGAPEQCLVPSLSGRGPG